jgi:hypothetical protein
MLVNDVVAGLTLAAFFIPLPLQLLLSYCMYRVDFLRFVVYALVPCIRRVINKRVRYDILLSIVFYYT